MKMDKRREIAEWEPKVACGSVNDNFVYFQSLYGIERRNFVRLFKYTRRSIR